MAFIVLSCNKEAIPTQPPNLWNLSQDAFLGEGTMINLGFNMLRTDSFIMALRWQDPDKHDVVEYHMRRSFYKREN